MKKRMTLVIAGLMQRVRDSVAAGFLDEASKIPQAPSVSSSVIEIFIPGRKQLNRGLPPRNMRAGS